MIGISSAQPFASSEVEKRPTRQMRVSTTLDTNGIGTLYSGGRA